MFPLFPRILLMLMVMNLSKKGVGTNLQGSQQNFDPSEYIFSKGTHEKSEVSDSSHLFMWLGSKCA